ncbi:fumarylacetoacetate hydrolase family protein [Usitatibacter rugosus]|uniref:fumarylacetoacetate hydrolase family protein n=1 Tax=Usitatibacter rugosus TaxID=2732067 RepID=UPI00148803C8|nr:fumarylacetoacetate hydrolase family protein [Usitatibacter rugosus]
MKLVTYAPIPSGTPRPGILLDDKTIVEASGFATMLDIIRGGAAAMAKLKELAAKPGTQVNLADVKLLAPIPRPSKNVFCVGWNYLEHFEEGAKKLEEKRELPKFPVFFSKTPTAVNDPTGTIPYDAAISTTLDWEVELGVVIGPGGKNISEADAMKHVFGYTVMNDVTWRDIQRRHGGQWHKGKSLDGTCPMGPVIVTADSLDHTNLKVECRVNGVVKQSSNTKFMYFKVPRLIADLSLGMTLEAGDLISSGTPEGVGFARTPPEFLKPGDLLETEIEGIGILRNPVEK